ASASDLRAGGNRLSRGPRRSRGNPLLDRAGTACDLRGVVPAVHAAQERRGPRPLRSWTGVRRHQDGAGDALHGNPRRPRPFERNALVPPADPRGGRLHPLRTGWHVQAVLLCGRATGGGRRGHPTQPAPENAHRTPPPKPRIGAAGPRPPSGRDAANGELQLADPAETGDPADRLPRSSPCVSRDGRLNGGALPPGPRYKTPYQSRLIRFVLSDGDGGWSVDQRATERRRTNLSRHMWLVMVIVLSMFASIFLVHPAAQNASAQTTPFIINVGVQDEMKTRNLVRGYFFPTDVWTA